MLRRASLLSLAAAVVAIAMPAQAQSLAAADRVVQDLLAEKLLLPTDKVWLALPSAEPFSRDVAVADALSQAMTARGLAVMGNVAMAQRPAEDGFQRQLAALKEMGVTKLVSLSPLDDLGTVTLRIVEIPGGWLKSVRSVSMGSGGTVASPPISSSGGMIPDEGVVSWNPQQGVGLQYSSLSGSGATYRRWGANGWGFQIAGIPALSFVNNRTAGFVNLGLQGMSTFLKTDRLRLYTLLGVGALYRPNESRSRWDSDTQTVSTQEGAAWDVGIAPGLGVDYRIYERFLLTGALGYTFSRQSFAAEPPSYAYSPGITLGTLVEW